jgi:ABC-type cobalt transport system substrate-binding protein
MKKSDLAMIVLIASASMLIAYFVAQTIFGGAANTNVKVKTIDKISQDFEEPSTAIFNKDAINPTVEVQIKDNSTATK